MSKYEQRIGKAGESIAAIVLRSRGLEMVECIGTPVKIIDTKKIHGIPYHRVVWGEKVSGDHRAVIPDTGVSVLAETKTIDRDTLRWSDLRKHQPLRLDLHASHNGVSLLIWVHSTGNYVLRWPVPGFAPRKSIKLSTARELDLLDITENHIPVDGR